jgi:ABC transporter substrate binding protein
VSEWREGEMNKRKLGSCALCVMLLALCASAAAQQPTKIPRIGYLAAASASADSARYEAFRLGLSELGYVEGKNIIIEWRYAELAPEISGKQLELLKEIVPKLHRVVTFYDPHTTVAIESSKLAREAAQQMGLRLIERHYTSVAELEAGIRALKTGDADAFFAVADPVVDNQFKLIIDTAITKRLPTSFARQSFVLNGGFSSYSVSFHEVGRLSAKYVQRILSGVKPKDLPVEGVDKIELVVNLKTAKQIGLTIPPNVLVRADRVIK